MKAEAWVDQLFERLLARGLMERRPDGMVRLTAAGRRAAKPAGVDSLDITRRLASLAQAVDLEPPGR